MRSDAAARGVIDLLAEQPVLFAAVVADRLGVSARSGQSALATLARHGIGERHWPETARRGRPTQYWVARELLELVAGWPGHRGPGSASWCPPAAAPVELHAHLG